MRAFISADPAFCWPRALSQCKMAIWGHSLCLCIYSPASFLFRSLQRPALTRALSRWIGRGRTRDRRFKHLKMMLFDVVYRRQLEASCAFCARPSSSSLRREAAHPLCAVIGCRRRSLSTRGFRSADLSLTLVSVAHMYHFVCSPWRAHERALHSTAGVLYTLLDAEYRGVEFY